MSKHPYCAVLTGDIIRSTALPDGELKQVREDLFAAIRQIKKWDSGLVRGKSDFFRGDAWQLLLTRPEVALRAAVYLRAALLAKGQADTRISIGLGTVDDLPSGRVSLSMGNAFELSGRGLDKMTLYYSVTICISKSSGPLSAWLPVAGGLCGSVISSWTERQAQAVCLAVQPDEPTHEEIGQRLEPPVVKQTVSKALSTAHWHAIREVIHCFEETPWNAVLSSD